jgi:LytS/YehU family sensor histidine kinase
LGAFTFLLCVLSAENSVQHGAKRVRKFILAILVASFFFALVDLLLRLSLTSFLYYSPWWWRPVHFFSMFMWALIFGGFSTFVYADLRRARESTARLNEAMLSRTRTAQNIMQTRLQIMQARVDPAFLFTALEKIGNLYDREPAKGQETIDDLIAYLRAAMPQNKDSMSTLHREVEFDRAYVAIVDACGSNRARLNVAYDDTWAATAFPSMLLQPLIRHAIASSRLTPESRGVITLDSTHADGKRRITLMHSGISAAASVECEALRLVRENLQGLHATDASVAIHSTGAGETLIVLEIPE